MVKYVAVWMTATAARPRDQAPKPSPDEGGAARKQASSPGPIPLGAVVPTEALPSSPAVSPLARKVGVKPCRVLSQTPGHEMAVAIEGRRDRGVAHVGLERLGKHTCGDHERGEGMPKLIEALPRVSLGIAWELPTVLRGPAAVGVGLSSVTAAAIEPGQRDATVTMTTKRRRTRMAHLRGKRRG
jgi:hypothetical protein